MDTLLQTKFYAPRRRGTDWVTRPRLFERLDAAQSARLTLVAAPAGFGKTTLVSDWLVQRGHKASWLSLDSEDGDPVLFWRYIVAALQTQAPELGADVDLLLKSPQPPPIQAILARLINEIAQHPAHLILVLDDYHIAAQPALDASLAFFVDHMPPNFQLIVTSRVDPNLPLARLRVRRELAEIRADDLRFSSSEAAAFLAQEEGIDVSAELVTALETRTEGWIAGLQMAALSLQGRQDASAFVDAFSGSHRYVMDYLTDEVLDRQPPDIHAFLLQTSILDRICADVCDAVLAADATTAGRSRRLLSHLERANLFLIPLDDEGQWYRYHHLFADLLRRRLSQQPGIDVADLHQRAARWHADQGNPGEAIHHFLAAEDGEAAADLVQAEGEGMLFRGEIQKLWSWVSSLPPSTFATRPQLAIGTAWIHYFRHEPQLAAPLLDLVDAYVANPTLPESERRLWLGEASVLRGWVSYAQGNIAEAIGLLRRSLELLPEHEVNYRGLASFFLGTLLIVSGEIQAGIEQTETGAQLCRLVGNYTAYIGTQTILSTVENEQGQARAARLRMEETLSWLAQQGLEQLPLAGDLYLGLGDLLYQANRVDDAVHCYTKARAIVEPYLRDTRVLLTLRLAWAHHHIRQDRITEAAQELTRIEADVVGRPLSAEMTETLVETGVLYLRLGNLARARHWIGDMHTNGSAPSEGTEIIRQIAVARFCLEEGRQLRRPERIDEAATVLSRILAGGQLRGRNRRIAQIGILQSLIALAQDDNAGALSALANALTAVPVDDYAGLFLDEGDALRPVLAQIAADPRHKDVHPAAVALLAHFGVAVLAQPATDTQPVLIAEMTSLPEPLTERELETLRLLASDLSTEEIAERLVVAVSTVRSYTKRVYAKLDVHSRVEALHKARALGVLSS